MRRVLLPLLLLLLLAPVATASGATWVVNTTDDKFDADTTDGRCDVDKDESGEQCTLRAALQQTNVVLGRDTVAFDVPGSFPVRIAPKQELPALGNVVLDATTQPGTQPGVPSVVLDGSQIPSQTSRTGLRLLASGVTIKGFSLGGWRDAIAVDHSNNHVIQGNYVGLAPDGTTGTPNDRRGVVIIGGSDVVVGGTGPGERNVVSANRSVGIAIHGANTNRNAVVGNRVGTTADGLQARANDGGIYVGYTENQPTAVAADTVVSGNLVSGNADDGIMVHAAVQTKVEGNVVGLGADERTLRNGEYGISVGGAPSTTIGGTTEEARNVVSGNGKSGIIVFGADSTGAKIVGNRIGTTKDGTEARGNAGSGIFLEKEVDGAAPKGVSVGGETFQEGNLVSGNGGVGVLIQNGSDGAKVQRNRIGTDVTGSQALPNTWSGVQVSRSNDVFIGTDEQNKGANIISGNKLAGVAVDTSTGTRIRGNVIGRASDRETALANEAGGVFIGDAEGTVVGSTYAENLTAGDACTAPCNVIADNGGNGVTTEGTSKQTTVRGNLVAGHPGMGIDLGRDGISANDPGDVDVAEGGPRNSPIAVLRSFHELTDKDAVSGIVDVADTEKLIVDIYAQDDAKGQGGQGRTFVATVTPRHRDFGGEFAVELGNVKGRFYTATVTDEEGNTSEFSPVCGGRQPDGTPNQHVAADADQDGLCDDWERFGLDVDRDGDSDLNLPQLGVELDEKDVFVEADTMDGTHAGMPIHPYHQTFTDTIAAFKDAPGGGLNLHVDRGRNGFGSDTVPLLQKIKYDGPATDPATLARVKTGTPDKPCDGAFGNKADREGPECAERLLARSIVYRYALFAKEIDDPRKAVGLAELNGRDILVGHGISTQSDIINMGGGLSMCDGLKLRCKARGEGFTFMHELGHSLGLDHGGSDSENHKPNYLSIMNYSLQDLSGTLVPYDFSRWKLADVDENDLDETQPFPGPDLPASADLRWGGTYRVTNNGGTCGTSWTELRGPGRLERGRQDGQPERPREHQRRPGARRARRLPDRPAAPDQAGGRRGLEPPRPQLPRRRGVDGPAQRPGAGRPRAAAPRRARRRAAARARRDPRRRPRRRPEQPRRVPVRQGPGAGRPG